MVFVGKVLIGVSPASATPRFLVGSRAEAPPIGDACDLVNADEIQIANAVGSFIATNCTPTPVTSEIIIDFKYSRATVGGVEVPIDTLVGTDTSSLWTNTYPTVYDPTKLTVYGYDDNVNSGFSYIGAAKNKILSGCTMVVQYKVKNNWGPTMLVKMGVDPHPTTPESGDSPMISFTDHGNIWISLWAVRGDNLFTDCETLYDVGDVNRVAMTVIDDRVELAINGDHTVSSYTLDPVYQPEPYIGVLTDCDGEVVERIEIYDPLPTGKLLQSLSRRRS